MPLLERYNRGGQVQMRYVAFLRAVNVGGHVVKMEQLRELFESLPGVSNVATFIQSGNVLFDSRSSASTLEKKIEELLEARLGYRVATFVRTLPELAHITQRSPFGETELKPPARIFIAFTRAAIDAAAKSRLVALNCQSDELSVHSSEIYWLCRTSFLDSKVGGPTLEKTLKGEATVRGLGSLNKLLAKFAAANLKAGSRPPRS